MAIVRPVSKNTSSGLSITIKGVLSDIQGLKYRLPKETRIGGANTIGNFLKSAAGTIMEEYINYNIKLAPKSISAISYSLGEVVAEQVRSEMPVWTGSLLQSVVLDISHPIGTTRRRRYVVNIKVGIDSDALRHERSNEHVGALQRVGAAINSQEPVENYALTYGPNLADVAAKYGHPGAIVGDAVRKGGGVWALIDTTLTHRSKEGVLHGVIRYLDNERAKLAAENQNRIENKAIERITSRLDNLANVYNVNRNVVRSRQRRERRGG